MQDRTGLPKPVLPALFRPGATLRTDTLRHCAKGAMAMRAEDLATTMDRFSKEAGVQVAHIVAHELIKFLSVIAAKFCW